MGLTRKKLKMLVDNFDILFPEPDPNAKIEDIIGCFEPKINLRYGLFVRNETRCSAWVIQ